MLRNLVLAVVLPAAILACATSAVPEPPPQITDPGVALVGVNVIPMDRERVLTDQTVLLSGDRIVAVGPRATTAVPAGAYTINAQGKYLIPGLPEMHAHIPGANAPEQLVQDIMTLYVANGVTIIRGMLGAPNQLELRSLMASGRMLGPTIIVGAPSLNGNSAPDPETAQRLVREHKAAGYDFLKLHPGLRRDVYDAIVATANEVGITFAGHISQQVGLQRTLEAGQSTIDHLDGYVEASLPAELRERALQGQQVPFTEMVRNISVDRVREFAGRTRDAGVWNVPTAYLWETFYSTQTPEQLDQRPELRYATPQMRTGWAQQKRNMAQSQASANVTDEDRRMYLEARRQVLKALADSGAGILLGTDTPQLYNVPGFSVRNEARLMVQAGLTPYQVLRSATSNVAEYVARDLGGDGSFGTIVAGNRADLVLLDGNPLENIDNIGRVSGVFVRGEWLSADMIRAMLEDIAARNAVAD